MLKDAWFAAIRDAGLDVALWPDVPDYAAIEFFIGWRPPEGLFAKASPQQCRWIARLWENC